MNDIKYEIWLPSTMDYFNSVSHFLLAPVLYLMSALKWRRSFSYGAVVTWKSKRHGINGLIVFTSVYVNIQLLIILYNVEKRMHL